MLIIGDWYVWNASYGSEVVLQSDVYDASVDKDLFHPASCI